MELNNFIFPAPQCNYTLNTVKSLVLVPRVKKGSEMAPTAVQKSENITESEENSKQVAGPTLESIERKNFIPCLYMPFGTEKIEYSDTTLVYFHGNAEDVGIARDFLIYIREELQVNVLAVEYPGYGIYAGDPTAGRILEDCELVFDYLIHTCGLKTENIILFGRSIGSGPATYLAARKEVKALILMSPYTSIRNVVKGLFGEVIQYLVAERFRNIDEIDKVKSPVLLIHGKRDKVIPYIHSKELAARVTLGKVETWFPQYMDHNSYEVLVDVVMPIQNFFAKNNLIVKIGKESLSPVFPNYDIEKIMNLKMFKLLSSNKVEKKEEESNFLVKMYDDLISKLKK